MSEHKSAVKAMPPRVKLSNRPFLVIDTIHRPVRQARTAEKGWGETPVNWDSFEAPSVVDRVKDRMLAGASIIIDITNKAVVKNRYSNTDDASLVSYYLEKYKAQVDEAMTIWSARTTARAA